MCTTLVKDGGKIEVDTGRVLILHTGYRIIDVNIYLPASPIGGNSASNSMLLS